MNRIIIRSCIIACLATASGCDASKRSTLPDVTELTIRQVHEAFREGKFTSADLVKAYLDRIDHLDGDINSISQVNERALEVAEQLDREFKSTNVLRPLHGIPIIVKDNINTKGLPTTAGSRALASYYPENDAFIIKRLVDAGAIILAKSNMAEWAFSPMHTESTTVGTTRNPYDLTRVPAGSSGGTGAAIAANFGSVGLGTDTGNSIRGPSSHNCLVGFRTTLGLVSRAGIVPLYLRNDVVGPMCRTVEDATRVLEVIAGYDPDDSITAHSNGKTARYSDFLISDGLKGARIGVLRELSEDNPHPDMKILFDQAVADLDSLGATIVDPFVVPGFAELRKNHWCADFRKDLESFLREYVKDDRVRTLEDVIRIGTNSSYTEKRIQAFAANSGRWNLPEVPCGDAYSDPMRIAFREAIEHAMDSLHLDAIVYPSWNQPPARIDFFQEEYKGDNNQVIAPHTGQPAFTVPMGSSGGGLPVGIQFLGRMFSETTLIRLAYGYEQGTKHRVPPPLD